MILILGGTSDSIEICRYMNEEGLKNEYILSVATDYGRDIAEKTAENVINGRMDSEKMTEFIKEKKIKAIIDATHPYATDVSKNAMECVKNTGIEYIRYERESLLNEISYDKCIVVENIEEACDRVINDNYRRVFIGTGSKNLKKYVDALNDREVFARVLPESGVISECESYGLNADNIIAMKGPFEKNMNVETFKRYNVDVLITKESGKAGGFMEKVDACIEMNIPVIVIKRQRIEYLSQTNKIEFAVETAKKVNKEV